MLLRFYRLTDKSSVTLLKLLTAVGDWLLEGAQLLLGTAGTEGRGGILGVLALLGQLLRASLRWLVGLAMFIIGGVMAFAALIGRFLRMLFGGVLFVVWRILGLFIRGGATTVQAVGGGAQRTMARRRARDEMDVVIAEDPLRVQNRLLSALVVVLGVGIVLVLIWATDPSRQATAVLLPDDNFLPILSAGTTQPDTDDVAIIAPTPIPTATQLPEALQSRGTIAYVARELGQTDIWAIGVGGRAPIRLTNSPADDRDPIWSPDGQQLAFSSRRDGNWELYVARVGDLSAPPIRLTFELGFQGRPAWSNDGLLLAYESYQGGNLDIYAIPVDGSDAPVRITDDPAPDYSPAWEPSTGRRIAFVSLRDRNQDIYIIDLNTLDVINLTNTPTRDEDFPAWSPSGRYLAYSALEQGRETVFVHDVTNPATPPQVMGIGRAPTWSPDGRSLAFIADDDDGRSAFLYAVPFQTQGLATDVVSVPYGSTRPTWTSAALPPSFVNAGGVSLASTQPLFIEQETRFNSDPPFRLNALLDVQAQNAVLSDRVNDSFNALRARTLEVSGVDFLGQLEDAFWGLDRRPELGVERRNWLMTGRAFAISRSSILGFPPPIELVREDLIDGVYWRVYVRVSAEAQSGQLGEPLRRLPWDLLSRTGGDVEAYNQGGRLRAEVPQGYYIDFTQLALDYGWERMPAGNEWRANADVVNYWLFRKPDGLDWYSAMREIYAESQLGGFVPTATPSAPIAGG